MTGLALLAFQGAGYTHLQGKYSEQVLAGISYLVSQQMPSGDLAGSKQLELSLVSNMPGCTATESLHWPWQRLMQ